MKLTAKKAVELSIELWEWLAETGEDKEDWPKWWCNKGEYWGGINNCFLCQYDTEHKGGCESCPYFLKYECFCDDDGTPYVEWDDSVTKRDSKKYAKQFLEQLKTILKDMEVK